MCKKILTHNNYFTSLLVFLLLLVALSPPVLASDYKDATEVRASARIVGGYEAQPGAWPWMVGLVYYGSPTVLDGQFCGGVFISSNWVLTAGHCVEKKSSTDFYVISGVLNLSSDSGVHLGVKRIIQHPDYNDYTLNNDFALLELTSNTPQAPISIYSGLPSSGISNSLTGEIATIVGWGSTSPYGDIYPEKLQQVELPIISNNTCNYSYPGQITDNMLCAGYSYGGKDSCYGDSGGPLMVFIDEQWVHAGVVSWGYGCAQSGYYGVYARTTQAINFIKQYVPDASFVPSPVTLPWLMLLLGDKNKLTIEKYGNGEGSDKTVAANFSLNSYPISLGKSGTGNGTITSTPADIDCSDDCSETYP